MKKMEYEWLPHLEDATPKAADGYFVGIYALALEGWRRGLKLRFFNKNEEDKSKKPGLLYELSSESRKIVFDGSRSSLLSDETINATRNKAITIKLLKSNNIPTPEGQSFEEEVGNKKIITYANKLGYPLVIKPVIGSLGSGVIAGIKDSDEFKDALHYIRYNLGYKNIIVEKFFEGEEYRIYVADNKVLGILNRIPANIEGDGKSTIKELILKKNELKKKNPSLSKKLIKIDYETLDLINNQNYSLESIPPQGHIITLKTKSNLSAGGDSQDVTDLIPCHIKQIAISALNSIPGLPCGGIDLIYNKEKEDATVIEINERADIGVQLFPAKGKARDIPSNLIDMYFPETKNTPRQNLFYFETEQIRIAIQNKILKKYIVPAIPEGELVLKKLLLKGINNTSTFFAWAQNLAIDTNIHGKIELIDNETAVLYIGAEKSSMNIFINTIRKQLDTLAIVYAIEESDYSLPIPIGFRIINDNLLDAYSPIRLNYLNETIKPSAMKKKKTVPKNKKIKINYRKKYKNVTSSFSWKITRPLRTINKTVRKVTNNANSTKR